MTAPQLRPQKRSRPLVAVVCAVPLLGEAMEPALEFAEVRTFSGRSGDIGGLLQWLRPDAVVVDDDGNADGAALYAGEADIPVVHICVRKHVLRLFHRGDWNVVSNGDGATSEIIRNLVAGALFARERSAVT
jgi:hypothetical protein